ncbi:hypothetical protein ACFQ2K_49270 [Streptomyces sanglieri]|uniref:Uncharacterized protein n=1 Tax=Streptomyces sanglieri TaxID=193460 RepID=A0ABW2X6W2_9ACTN
MLRVAAAGADPPAEADLPGSTPSSPATARRARALVAVNAAASASAWKRWARPRSTSSRTA